MCACVCVTIEQLGGLYQGPSKNSTRYVIGLQSQASPGKQVHSRIFVCVCVCVVCVFTILLLLLLLLPCSRFAVLYWFFFVGFCCCCFVPVLVCFGGCKIIIKICLLLRAIGGVAMLLLFLFYCLCCCCCCFCFVTAALMIWKGSNTRGLYVIYR